MPITTSAKKALRGSKRKAIVNQRARMVARKAISLFKKNPTAKNLEKTYSVLDLLDKKNIVHKNKARRLKSRFAKMVKQKTPATSSVKKVPKKKSSGAKKKPKNKKKK